jgi:hypothetical protein
MMPMNGGMPQGMAYGGPPSQGYGMPPPNMYAQSYGRGYTQPAPMPYGVGAQQGGNGPLVRPKKRSDADKFQGGWAPGPYGYADPNQQNPLGHGQGQPPQGSGGPGY